MVFGRILSIYFNLSILLEGFIDIKPSVFFCVCFSKAFPWGIKKKKS